jgi:lipoyl(octanoyl) transferase
VTYHGPGQLVLYVLVDVRRSKLSVRELVTCLETAIINTLAKSNIEAYARPMPRRLREERSGYGGQAGVPACALQGVLVPRVGPQRQHGHDPFLRINPCGYAGMAMTQTSALGGLRASPRHSPCW